MTPEEARERRDAQLAHERLQRDDDLRAALSHAWGRRLIVGWLNRHHLRAADCPIDSAAAQRRIGAGEVAERIEADCFRVAPDEWRRMHDENNARVAKVETLNQALAQAERSQTPRDD